METLRPSGSSSVELSILMPCLNEQDTLANCIRAARSFLRESNIDGEVLVADNGSGDASQAIAVKENARLIYVATRGYGAALAGGIAEARGRFVVIGDADESYDFLSIGPFLERLRQGDDLVIGNRFQGGIQSGAMPLLHRYLGNPVLSFIGRLFFRIPIGDFHCGLRGLNRESITSLGLATTGMEFASEMIVKSVLAGYRVSQVPTVLYRDKRPRPPHLRTWRDGWRHLRFLILYSPRWLFFYPGCTLFACGLIGMIALWSGPVMIDKIGFDINTFMIACFALLVGLQTMCFAVIARKSAAERGLLPPSRALDHLLQIYSLERVLLSAVVLGLGGFAGVAWCVAEWASVSFGSLAYASLLRVLIPAMTAVTASLQLVFTAFLASVITIPVQQK